MANKNVPKFLLDQGFPKPPFPIQDWDHSVEYIHLSDFDSTLSTTSTPDWMVVLAAQAGGCTGFVSRDRSQLDEPETMVALEHTRLSVVTWKKGVDDTIREWGMILAYMPLVIKRIALEGPHIFTLPNPRLTPDNVQKKSDALSRVAKNRKVAYRKLRSDAVQVMRSHLRARGRDDLIASLDTPPQKGRRAPVEPTEPSEAGRTNPPTLDL